MSELDVVAFVAFIAVVIGISLYAARKEETTEDYFLAGRGLSWWLIGFSLIASNISSEHFVGMAGQGYRIGLAIASYEWGAAVTLVFVMFFLLPLYLRTGIYTMPQFLEIRYNSATRALMAFYLMVAYVFVALATVLYSGALGLQTIFGIDLTVGVWLIGVIAAAYTIYGGLKAVVWTDLIQGIGLIIGGIVVTVLGFQAVGGVGRFFADNSEKLHLFMPHDDLEMPWTALLLGIWIPHTFYWGCNQYITQRALAARSLRQGQKGLMLAASIKIFMPIIIVLPGIMAYDLYAAQIAEGQGDSAYPLLIKNILPAGLRGLMLAALAGAIMSSLDSMLNSASTIFTLDFYKRYFVPGASGKELIVVGRVATAAFAVFACLVAPFLGAESFKGIFLYMQKFWGFISVGIAAAFVYGLIVRRAPPAAAIAAMGLNVIIYGALLWWLPTMAFLNHMAITFLIIVAVMTVITIAMPLREARRLPVLEGMDLTPSRAAWGVGAGVLAAVVVIYVVFR